MEIKEYTASSVSELLKIVESFPHMMWIFRGQADAEWPLLPKAGRHEYFIPNSADEDACFPNQDLARFEQWRHWAVACQPDLPSNDFEALAVAQHYGLATRLLDWTTNPLIAFYFAVEDQPDRDGSLHLYLPDLDRELTAKKFSGVDRPVRFSPRPLDRRLLNQYAAFTYHPEPHKPLLPEPFPESLRQFAPTGVDSRLNRICIPWQSKRWAMSHLDQLGINRRTIFPDLEGLSAHINWETRQVAGEVPESDPAKPLPEMFWLENR
jgi:hypothetical protein